MRLSSIVICCSQLQNGFALHNGSELHDLYYAVACKLIHNILYRHDVFEVYKNNKIKIIVSHKQYFID